MIDHVLLLLSGVVAGMILYQSAVVAPTLFKSLEIEQTRPVLRKLFPMLFRIAALIGGFMFVLAVVSEADVLVVLVGLLTLLLALVCALMVPSTNRAADEEDTAKFARLHRISVSLTLVVLILNLGWLFFL